MNEQSKEQDQFNSGASQTESTGSALEKERRIKPVGKKKNEQQLTGTHAHKTLKNLLLEIIQKGKKES